MGFNRYWTFATVTFPPGVDGREDMEYDVPYRWVNPTGVCSAPHCDAATDLTVTKHPHAGQPRGHLYTRCPDHQDSYERRWSA